MNHTATKVLVIFLLVISLGVVVYEIVSNAKLHNFENKPETIIKQENQEAEVLNEPDLVEIQKEGENKNDEMICTLNFAPVCGTLKSGEKSFGNKCEAEKAGATNIIEGLCSPQESCPTQKDPVCGIIDGNKTSFDNLCIAEAAGAKEIEPGICPLVASPDNEVVLCPEMPDPVCATLEGKKTDYENACVAQQVGATEITPGKCPVVPADLDLQVAP